ncbi:HSP70/90 co-chaperone [Malassezia sp. CBS 17886]|nr:HSP70/90 co-chaperone [Malassezia sp. CBS 17886]
METHEGMAAHPHEVGTQDARIALPTAAPEKPRGGDLDAQLRSFDEVPLFMKTLPKDDAGADSTNTAVDALQALAFEGPPDEAAETCKEQGNEYFRARRFREALGFYRQGLDAQPDDARLRETLFLNSAACNLELQNYGRALHDARGALETNAGSIKALFRAARAFLALDRIDHAVGCCELGVQKDPGNAEFQRLHARVTERRTQLVRLACERDERARRKKLDEDALTVALLSRGLWIERGQDMADNPSPAHFDAEARPAHASDSVPLSAPQDAWRAPDPIRTPLVLPVTLLYPQHSTSDLIASYHEDTPIGMHLGAMFPPEARGSLPWDPRGEYVARDLSVIAPTRRGRLLRMGHQLSLRDILDQAATDAASGRPEDRDGVALRSGMVHLVVLPRGSVAERTWVDTFKRTHRSA